jgi:hypothetical protein
MYVSYENITGHVFASFPSFIKCLSMCICISLPSNVSFKGYMVSNGKMSDELESSIMTSFKILFQHMPGMTGKSQNSNMNS